MTADPRGELRALAARIDLHLADYQADPRAFAAKVARTAAAIAGADPLPPVTGTRQDGSAVLGPDDLITVAAALDHAEQLLRERASAWCDDCITSPSGACPEHLDDLDRADLYAALAARLGEGTAPAACHGCAGRGTGTHCCLCGLPIPPGLRREPGDPSELPGGAR